MTEKDGNTSFEKGLQESFRDFRQSPDPAVWSRIDAAMQRRKRIVLFSRLAVAASLLLLFSISGWLVFNSSDVEPVHHPLVTHDSEINDSGKEIPDFRETLSTEKEKIAGTRKEPAIAQAVKPERTSLPALEKPQAQQVHDGISEPQLPLPVIPEPSEELSVPDPADIAVQEKPELAGQTPPDQKDIDFVYQTEDFLPDETAKESNWQLALAYGTIQGQAVSDPSESYDNHSANFGQDPFSAKISGETSQFSNIEKTHHAPPLSLGFMVNRNFSGSWGIETGLLFTRLRTVSKTDIVNDEYTEYGSDLFYLGLPVAVRLNMIQGRRFGMYLSQGAVFEKGVRTRYYLSHYAMNELKNSEVKTYMAEGVQISSLTAIGFEFRLYELLSLYAQPGLQVFFLNETQPYNIRSSSAIWPSLQAGLKFQL